MKRTTVLSIALIGAVVAGDSVAATLRVPQDYGSIQAACSAALPGDVVRIAPGTYHEHVLVGIGGISLVGKPAGKVVIDGDYSGIPLTIAFAADVRIEGIRVQHANIAGIAVTAAERPRLSKCTVRDSSAKGLRLIDVVGAVADRCRIEDVGDIGIELFGTGSVISKCRVLRAHGVGISAMGTSLVLESNDLRDIGGDGIALAAEGEACRNFAVARNSLRAIVGSGIQLGSDAGPGSLRGNVIDGVERDGITCSSLHAVELSDNVVRNAADAGLDVVFVGQIVSGNRVQKCKYGIHVNGPADKGVLIRNRCDHNDTFGVWVHSSQNLLYANSGTGNEQYDLYNPSGDANQLIANHFGSSGP